MRSRPIRIPVTAGLAIAMLVTACSSDGADDATPSSTTASTATSSTVPTDAGRPVAPDVTVTGPVAGTPQTSDTAGMDATGYVEEEFFVSGTAISYDATGDLTDDGRWSVTERDDAAFTTRILVRRPADPTDASGVIVVEWNNVSSGFDATPDWGFTKAELMRAGHVHIGVSAQKGGVDAPDGRGLAGDFGSPLTSADPERYGSLSHPGDDHSYDLFAQIGAMAAKGPSSGIDPLDGFPRDHVIAVGESQSAFRLTTYINGIHPAAPVFDGFLVHSRGGGNAPFDSSGTLASSTVGQVRVRDDLDVPVFIFSTETDLTVLGYAPARQPDTDRIRSWEIAGTAHVDAFLLGGDPVGIAGALGCDAPINDGPQHLALKAAVHHLVAWVVDGTPPPAGDRIAMSADLRSISRDGDGNALGGIRLAPVEVPAATLSGDAGGGSPICFLFGSTEAFPTAELVDRYGSSDAYVALVAEAYDGDVADGHALEADRPTVLAEAAEVRFA